jgi:hypothetical protein
MTLPDPSAGVDDVDASLTVQMMGERPGWLNGSTPVGGMPLVVRLASPRLIKRNVLNLVIIVSFNGPQNRGPLSSTD